MIKGILGYGGVLLHSSFLDLHHLLNVHVQLANKNGIKKKINDN
jgi:hypothetical protein